MKPLKFLCVAQIGILLSRTNCILYINYETFKIEGNQQVVTVNLFTITVYLKVCFMCSKFYE